MTNILLVGESHIGAVKRGYNEEPERFPWMSFASLGKGRIATTRFFEVDETKERVLIISEHWNKLEFSKLDKDVPDLLVLSLPINTSRILRDVSWDTHVPWRLRQSDHETPLSDAFVNRLIDQDSGYAIDYTVALAELGMNVAVLEAPRFFEDAGYLKHCRLDVIQFIDKLYRQRVVDRLGEKGVGVIPQAPHTISDMGATKMEFDNERQGDVHHANLVYGQIVLEQIQNYAIEQLGMRLDA